MINFYSFYKFLIEFNINKYIYKILTKKFLSQFNKKIAKLLYNNSIILHYFLFLSDFMEWSFLMHGIQFMRASLKIRF